MMDIAMTWGVRAFIGTVFAAIGLSFLATTAVLLWEFRQADWLMIANFYSHLFVFFPTFGIVTLIAFYTPACVFLDMYLKHVPWGPQRFAIGFVVAVGISISMANVLMGSEERSIFEVHPEVLLADRGEPPECVAAGNCLRLPILRAADNVRRVSQSRIGLSDLARNCKPDALKDVTPAALEIKRYCFASTPLPADPTRISDNQRSPDLTCCRAQERFTAAVKSMHDAPGGRSMTSVIHATLLPLKIFFAIILLVISVMLAIRRKAMEQHYQPYMNGIERGVLIGALAMVIYPVMSHAFLQSAALLYFGGGPSGGFRSTAPLVSFAFAAWGLLLLFFFYSRRDKEMQSLARMGGMIGSAVAVVKYDQIIDLFVRIFGSGAGLINLALLAVAVVAALVILFGRVSRDHDVAASDSVAATVSDAANDR